MNSRLLLSLCCMLLILAACNSNNSNEAIAKLADTSGVMMQDEMPAANNTVASHDTIGEINNFNLPDSSIKALKIIYRNTVVDTVYGYQKGDTLHTEGDVMYLVPPPHLAAGTTHNLWLKQPATGIVEIPFSIRQDYPKKDSVLKAIKMWEAVAKVKFIPRTSSSRNYIEFIPSQFTQSFIGMIKGGQTIELADWAKSGNIAHEIGHALGLYHEHTRRDRDGFVKIDPSCAGNINYRHAYKNDPYAGDFDKYNYFSIMHYPPNSCMQVPGNISGGVIGQREFIAPSDFNAIKIMYKL